MEISRVSARGGQTVRMVGGALESIGALRVVTTSTSLVNSAILFSLDTKGIAIRRMR